MNVFFTNTPYHVLLSYAIAQENDRSLLFASGEEPGRELIEAIKNHPASPFDQVVVSDKKRHKHRLFQAIERRRTIQDLRSFVRSIDERVDQVHIFHKGSTEPLALFHFLETYGPGYDEGVYVEDGTEAYSNHEFGEKSRSAVAMGKLLYGQWWHDATPLYNSEYVQQAKATFPDSLRPELRDLSNQAIPATPLSELTMQDIVNQYFQTLGIRIPEDITHIVVAPHSNLLADQPELAQRLKAAVSDLDGENKLAIKYHPRDASAAFLDDDAFTIPRRIPVETVYIAKENLGYIIGGRSTAMITARWLTEAKVLSFYSDLSDPDKEIESTLSHIGVEKLKTRID